MTQASSSTSAAAPNISHTHWRMSSGTKLNFHGLSVTPRVCFPAGSAACRRAAHVSSSARACASWWLAARRTTPHTSRCCPGGSFSGSQTSLPLTGMRAALAGSTPTTVAHSPLIRTSRPAMCGSALKPRRHRFSPSNTTSAAPGASSDGSRPRPSSGVTPSSGIIEAVTRLPG